MTLAVGTPLEINYAGYACYIGPRKLLSPIPGTGTAKITLHTGDQQDGTNPGGKGKGTTKDGTSYDADINWQIGLLQPGQDTTLTIYVAPGKNPAGKREFTSPGCTEINTDPVLRAWTNLDLSKKNFKFGETFSNTLEVCVEKMVD